MTKNKSSSKKEGVSFVPEKFELDTTKLMQDSESRNKF